MQVYIKDIGKTDNLYFYYPNTDIECIEGFWKLFKNIPFDEITEEQQREYITKAKYQTTLEIYLYWRKLIMDLQDVADKFESRGILHKLTMKGKSIFVTNTDN